MISSGVRPDHSLTRAARNANGGLRRLLVQRLPIRPTSSASSCSDIAISSLRNADQDKGGSPDRRTEQRDRVQPGKRTDLEPNKGNLTRSMRTEAAEAGMKA